jgi:hypothetical protein
VNVTVGTIAFIESISGLFIYNNGWRPLDTSSDGPVISAAPLSISVESGTEYTTTIEASDPDELPVVYSVTTTGKISADTVVTIDEATGAFTLLSNTPYDNFSVVLTVSDGVFATTRTIPVTIENREPVFTVEPAASVVANSGSEFSYQYTATDADDSTTLDFTVTQDLATVFPNFQHIQRIHPKRSGDASLQPTYGYEAATGGNFLVVSPLVYSENGVYVYKYNTSNNYFELLQTEIIVQNPIGNLGSEYAAAAVSNEFLYVSEKINADATFYEKILKYDSNTEQFVEWSGGNLGSTYTLEDREILSAEFCETSNGDTALLVGVEDDANATGRIKLFVYDQGNDEWVYKQSYFNGDHTPFVTLVGSTQIRTFTWPKFIQRNPQRNHEVCVRANASSCVVEVLLDDDQGSVADNVYELRDHLIAFDSDGLGYITDSQLATVWDNNGTALFFENENTIWASQPTGELFKIERGSTPDTDNQNPWLSDSYTGGTATITSYLTTTGTYTPNIIADIGYDTLIINGSVGSLGAFTFQLDNLVSTVQYIDNFEAYRSDRLNIGNRNVESSSYPGNYTIFNRDHSIVINIGKDTNWFECYINTFGLGIDINVDSDGTVSGIPKSFGTYNVTTSVSDSIDTISDTISLEVPIGVNFTQNPPTSKTIDALSTQSFTSGVTTSNYNKSPRLKISSDIPHEYKTIISNASSMTVKGNELIVLVDQEVRVYTIDGLGELSSSYTVVDTSSIAGDYSKITNLYSTDDYVILGRKGTSDSAGLSQQHVATRELTQTWNYTTDGLGRITGIGDIYRYYKFLDLHQTDEDATLFFEYSYREIRPDGNSGRHSLFQVNLKKYDPKTNRVTTLNANDLTFTISNDDRREYPRFFRTHHKDYDGDAGTGVGYLMHYVYGTNQGTVVKFTYDIDGNINTIYSHEYLTSDRGFVAASSSDGSYFAAAYQYSPNGQIIVKGTDAGGVERTWGATTSNIGNFSHYKSCNFIKINNEYHLATLLYNYDNSTYDIGIWEIPELYTDPLVLVSTFSVDFTDANVGDIVGPIGSDNSNNLIVGNWLFTINVLAKNLTKHSVMASALTGQVSATLAQRLEYFADIDTWVRHASTAPSEDSVGWYPENSASTYAFKINPITKVVTNVASNVLGDSDHIITTGMNQSGEYFTVSNRFHDPRTTDYPKRTDIETRYYAGNIFGSGSLILYSKTEGTYLYHSIITKSSTPVLGNIVGDIVKITSNETNQDYLIVSYPWHNSDTDDAQGGIYSYNYDEALESWNEVDFLQKTYAEFDTGNTRDNERQYNNFGHSISKYDNFIIESGPRDVDDDGNIYSNNPINILGPRDGSLYVDRTFRKGFTDTALRNLEGYAENVFAKSYLAFGNTGTVGNYSLNKNGELIVFNSAYNSPSFTLQDSATTSPITFDNKHTLVPPEPFNGGTKVYSTGTNGGALEIYEGGEAKPFEPEGDYTIEFHFKHASSGSCYILSTIGYRGTFTNFNAYFKLYVHNQTLYLTDNWGTGNGLPPSTPAGVSWANAAIADDVWRHYAIVYDSINEQHTLWIDGEKVSTTSYPSNPKVWVPKQTTTYYWSVGRHRSDLPENSDQASTTDFNVANIIVNLDAQYNPNDTFIDISVFENGTIADKVTDKTWGAFCIGKEHWVNYVGRDDEYNDSGTRLNGIIDTGTSGPDIYTPQTIDNNHWSKHIHGSDNMLISASDNNLYIYNRGVDNKFSFEKYFTDSRIKKIEAVDNEADTVAVLTDSGVKIYSRGISSYLRSATSISNGTVTLSPKYLGLGSYNLSTIATDSINTSIKNTAITQNPVLDLSTVQDRSVNVEWGSTDTQVLPVSSTYTTTWTAPFVNTSSNSGQLALTDGGTNYSLTVTPGVISSNVTPIHDKFSVNLTVALEGESKVVSNNTYYRYASWKLGPTDRNDWDGGIGTGFRSLNPVLDGNEGADQSLYYGYSVSMSEIDIPNSTGYLAVGQPRSNWDNTGVSTTRGEVYVYQWNNSQGANELSFVGNAHQQRIQNSITFGTDTNADGQHFGWIVDITADGENLLVTAPGINTTGVDETQSSSAQAGALVYARQSDGTFANPKQIDFSDISLSSSQLGTAAAISDDASTIVFGSANYPLDGNQYGLVSVWRRNNSTGEYSSFSLIDHITNNWAAASNTGKDVAVSADGSVIAIGQPGDGNAQSGKVLVYRYTAGGYQLVQSLTANFEGDDFGYSVDMTPDGGTIVVGSPGFVVSTQAEAGAVFIYDGNTTDGYTLTSSQLPSISTTGVTRGGRIGHSVTIDKFGSTIIAGAPYTVRTTRSSNNFEQGSVYTMYKESGSWSMYNKRYIPWQVKNIASYNGVSGVQNEWRNRTYGWSVCLAPNGSQLAVGDPTLGSEVTRSTTERVWTHQPSKVDLIHKVREDNSSLFTSTSYNDYNGNLESQAVTMGTGSPLTVILPDFWPTGIASKSGYTYTVLSNSGGVSASTNVDGNLEISHTRNSATVAAGSTLILITPPPPIQNESAPTPQSLGIVINWI